MTNVMRAARPAAIGAVALLIVACSSSSSSSGASTSPSASSGSSSGKLEKSSIVVGTLPVIDVAPLFIAIKNGYFTQQGLNVKTLPGLQSTAALPDLLHGVIDILAGNYTSYFEGDARKVFSVDVVGEALDCVPGDFEILTLPGSGITTAAGLAGKTIAVNLTSNIQTLATDAILKADGVTGKPTYVPIPFPDMAAALKDHRVDAISVVEPYLSGAEHSVGAVPVMSQCQGPTAGFPISGYFASTSWLAKYPNTAHAFQRGMRRAQAYANANPQAVKAILPSYIKITAAAAAHVSIGTFPPTINVSSLQQLADLMRADGMLASPLQISNIASGSLCQTSPCFTRTSRTLPGSTTTG
jgi:NitT/TauT family transport system substrate-binding protein